MIPKIPVSVLHVEDDPADARLMKNMLSDAGGNVYAYDVTHTTCLADAARMMREESYSAILLDLNLPDGQGVDSLKKLKGLNPNVPVIVITGMDDETIALQVLREGAQEYIVKHHGDSHVIQRIIQSSIFRKRVEMELFRKAHFDALTGLPNRVSFEKMAQPMLQRARRWERREALMFIDLNKFKQINDTHGHEIGNTVLKEVAVRLKATLRSSDLIARYAGDEFVVYLDSGGKVPLSEEMCKHLAEKILDAMHVPMEIEGQSIPIDLSIGIAIFPDAGQTFDILLKNADQAMYQAKNDPDRKYWIFGEGDGEAQKAVMLFSDSPASLIVQPANSNEELLSVLIIDDSMEDRTIYKSMLQQSGKNFEILEAGTIREGERIIEKCAPHCILLDYSLPDLNGLEFLKKMHGQARSIDAAIVVITGHQDRDTAVEAMKFGAKDYVVKGEIESDRFVKIVSDAIEKNMLEKELNAYQAELERSNRELSDFAHTVAHDLKAPMRKILMFCELLEEKGEKILDDEGRAYIKRMEVSSARMQALVDNLLTYAQIMKSGEERQTVALSALAYEVLEDLDIWLKEHGATVIVHDLPTLPVYPTRIKQLFSNLISNAVKYARPGEMPLIKIRAENNGQDFIIAVEDNGMGIAANDLGKIFAPFRRLHAAEEIEGTGLGLSICQKVVEKHNGKIWAESKKGQGTTFLFSLPVS